MSTQGVQIWVSGTICHYKESGLAEKRLIPGLIQGDRSKLHLEYLMTIKQEDSNLKKKKKMGACHENTEPIFKERY